jgi:hypothetical protein
VIGNDVVDLGDPELRGERHPRFDARVFDARERARIDAPGAPPWLRWALWAAKEAAYKLVCRRDPGRGFSPRRFQVRLGADLRGAVRAPGEPRPLPVRVSRQGDALHAVAHEPGLDPRALLAALAAGDGSSEAARALACGRLAECLGAPPAALSVVRRGRIPELRLDGELAPLALSLSHHGRYVAFAAAPLRGEA